MKKIIRLTESDLTRLVTRVLEEQKIKLPATGEDPNFHRYDLGANMPGLEKFLANPLDDTITAELMSQLKNDRYKKGKIVIIFNGLKYKEVESFIQKIQADARRNRCYTITDYNYNNRFLVNTQITITATPGECKKAGSPVQQPAQPEQTTQPNPETKPAPVCRWGLSVPMLGEIPFNKEEIIKFQQWCRRPDSGRWKKEFKDGTSQSCTAGATGKWGCCTATCWRHGEKDYYDYLRNQQGNDNFRRGGKPGDSGPPNPYRPPVNQNPPNQNRPPGNSKVPPFRIGIKNQ